MRVPIGARPLSAAPFVLLLVLLVPVAGAGRRVLPRTSPQAVGTSRSPVLVVDTAQGTFEIGTYPNDAPKTVAHIVELATRGFYDGLRVHRMVPGFVVQFGDPQTRDPSKRELWGKGAAASSGAPIGVAEMTKKRTHKKGAVAVAHAGDPANADSQVYVTLADRPDLDGKYTVFGEVTAGADVPERLQVGDLIAHVSVKP